MRFLNTLRCAVLGAALLACCEKNTKNPEKPAEKTTTATKAAVKGGAPVIYTTFYPTTYFAQRIAGDRARVVCPVPADADPIFWKPEARVIAAYQSADLIILNGAGYEKWVQTASLPESRVVDTATPLADRFITIEGPTHSHGADGEHTHAGLDGHTWMDPLNAKAQAGVIRDELVKRIPGGAATFNAGYEALAKDLDALNDRLLAVSTRLSGTPLVCSHPAYNYLAARYRWSIRNVDFDPGEMPDDHGWAQLKDVLIGHPAKHMLWERAPSAAIAERLKSELGIESVEFSPCETMSEEDLKKGDDYLKVMNRNVERMEHVARASSP